MAEKRMSEIDFGAESPIAVVYGMDRFFAKQVCEMLVERGLNVLGVGEMEGKRFASLENEKKFRHTSYLMESWAKKISPAYVFDLKGGEREIWEWAERWGCRTVIVQRWEDGEDEFKKREIDWRLVKVGMVYGPGMSFEEAGWLGKALGQAVYNEKISLPKGGEEEKWPLLYVTDLVELLMGACFFPNVSEEELVTGGKEVSLGELAKVLEDTAKTTEGFEYKQETRFPKIDPALMGKEERVSWEAEVEIRKGVELTLQDLFQRKEKGELERNKSSVWEVRKEEEKEREEVVKKEEEKEKGKKYQTVEVWEEQEDIEQKTKVATDEKEEKIDWLKRVEEKIEKEVEERMEKMKREMEKPAEKVIREEKKEEIPQVLTEDRKEEKEVVSYGQEKKKKFGPRWGRKKEEKEPKIKEKKKKKKWIALVLTVILMGVIISPIWTLMDVYRVYKSLLKIEPMVTSKNWVMASELLEENSKKVSRLETKIEDWGLRDWVWGGRFSDVVVLEREVLEVGEMGLELMKTGSVLTEGIFQKKEVDWEGGMKQMETGLGELEERLSMVQARLGGDWSWLPAKWRREPRKMAEKLAEDKGKIGLLRESLDVWSYMAGVGGERREFLVLLQNEAEIRPTGGFIGSVGFLSFQDGQFLDFSVRDIYSLDGQLKGHVEPPEELRKYLGEPGWYLRDANWDPDFLESVSDINWFLEKEIGKKVDGVIGADLAVAKKIVGVVEKVYIPDYEEEITVDNLYEQAELYSENKFFPGSSQKATFLGVLGKVLLEEMKLLGPDKYLELGEAFLDAFLEGELMVGINGKDEGAERAKEILALTGWDGQLQKVSCGKKENCVVNYLHVNEANVGINKANYFLKRGMEQVVDLAEDGFSSTLKISYENTAESSAWPAGDYKTYVRIYIPAEARLDWVMIEGKKIEKEELVEKRKGSKKEIGFLLTVPILEKRRVEIKYDMNFQRAGNSLSFIYYLEKQAGWGEGTSFSLLISLPEGWNPLQVYPETTLVSEKLLYSEQIKKDLKIGVELGR
jgi:hypothetical protein